jgi:hypothetical protein
MCGWSSGLCVIAILMARKSPSIGALRSAPRCGYAVDLRDCFFFRGIGLLDQSTGLPEAGWYTDPSDGANERWWGGVEWTAHTRAVAPVVEAESLSPYAMREVVGGAVGGGEVGTNSWDYQPTESYGKASASWYDPEFLQTFGPPPRNGMAVASLVFGILANVFDLLMIPMILAFVFGRKARNVANTFALTRRKPAGRTMAGWGIGLATLRLASYVVAIVWLTVFFTTGWGYNEQRTESTLSGIAAQNGAVGVSVDCPASASLAPGSVIDCTLTAPNGDTGVLRGTVPTGYTASTLSGSSMTWEFIQS